MRCWLALFVAPSRALLREAAATRTPTSAYLLRSRESILAQPMTPDQLRAWRERMKFSQQKAADTLGLSLRGYQNYESGERPIRRYIALACAAISHGLCNFWCCPGLRASVLS